MKFHYQSQQDYLDRFLTHLTVVRNLSEATLKAYRCDLNGLFTWLARENTPVLDQQTLLQYFEMLQQERNLKAKSLQRKFISIRQYCEFLNQENISNETFFRFNSRKFILPKALPKTLSMREVRNLIEATQDEYEALESEYHKKICLRDSVILELLFCLGLRIGEISQMNVDDYNRDEETLLIHGKGRKERMLFLSSPAVVKKLMGWLKFRDCFQPSCNALFVNKYGDRLSIYSVENIFEKYKRKSMINPMATPHYLRHSFATQLLNNGATIRDVQELLGHNSIVSTQIYTEVSYARKKEVMMRYNERNFLF